MTHPKRSRGHSLRHATSGPDLNRCERVAFGSLGLASRRHLLTRAAKPVGLEADSVDVATDSSVNPPSEYKPYSCHALGLRPDVLGHAFKRSGRRRSANGQALERAIAEHALVVGEE